jgi:hypothetical protein
LGEGVAERRVRDTLGKVFFVVPKRLFEKSVSLTSILSQRERKEDASLFLAPSPSGRRLG